MALLCTVNIFPQKQGIICRKFLITNNLNYFCRMKKMNMEQMENLKGGGMSQRACSIAGVAIVGGLVFSMKFAAATFLVALAGDCF